MDFIVQRILSLKVGFHYPSSRPEFTGRVDGPRTRVHFLTPVTRQLGPWTRVVETDLDSLTRAMASVYRSLSFSLFTWSHFNYSYYLRQGIMYFLFCFGLSDSSGFLVKFRMDFHEMFYKPYNKKLTIGFRGWSDSGFRAFFTAFNIGN